MRLKRFAVVGYLFLNRVFLVSDKLFLLSCILFVSHPLVAKNHIKVGNGGNVGNGGCMAWLKNGVDLSLNDKTDFKDCLNRLIKKASVEKLSYIEVISLLIGLESYDAYLEPVLVTRVIEILEAAFKSDKRMSLLHGGRFSRVKILSLAEKSTHDPKYTTAYLAELSKNMKMYPQFEDERVSWQQLAVVLTEYKKDRTEHYDWLEAESLSYPLTKESVDAFFRLNRYSHDPKQPYIFSKNLLRSLARHQHLVAGMSDFIVAKASEPIRWKQSFDSVKTLKGIELYEFLFSLRLYKPLLKILDESMKKKIGNEQGSLQSLLARTHLKIHNYQESLNYFSLHRSKVTKKTEALEVSESIADLLYYQGFYKDAAMGYQALTSTKLKDPSRWYLFWNTYQGLKNKDHKRAIDIQTFKMDLNASQKKSKTPAFNPKLGIPSRDDSFDGGRLFWKARYLAVMGMKKEAQKLMTSLVTSNKEGFYTHAAMSLGATGPKVTLTRTLAKHPKIHQKLYDDWLQNRIQIPSEITGWWKMYQTADQLIQSGYLDHARDEMRELLNHRLDDSQLLAILKTSDEVKDFYLKSRAYRLFIARLWPQGLNHQEATYTQQAYTNVWQHYYPKPFFKDVYQLSKEFSLDPLFFYSIMRAESEYDPLAVSRVGAKGLMQIMPYTAYSIKGIYPHLLPKKVEPASHDLMVPSINLALAASYLHELQKVFKDQPALIAAAYNAGPRQVLHWLKRHETQDPVEFIEAISFKETRQYVKRVLFHHARYQRIYPDKRKPQTLQIMASAVDYTSNLF